MMDMPQLRIQSRDARLGLNIQQPVQKIEQHKADLSIKQPAAELQMRTKQGKLSIDTTEARADVDLKSIFRRTEEAAQKGYEDWMKGLARMSRQGDELAAIHKKGNPIVRHAKENSKPKQYEFNIGWIPSHFSVKVDYEPGDVNINWQTNKPVIDANINKPTLDYTPGKVEGYMKQWPELQIDFVGGKIDKAL